MQNEPQLSAEMEKRLKEYECTGYMCNHETAEDHYIINKHFLATALEEQKKAIVEEYGDYRLVVKKRFGYEIGRTLRFFLAPHTQHKKGDDENL